MAELSDASFISVAGLGVVALLVTGVVCSVVAILTNNSQNVQINDLQTLLNNLQTLLQLVQTGSWIWHTPARAASITNVTPLEGEQTVDGVALVTGDRVLLTNQTDAKENGLWLVDAAAWTRPSDFPQNQAAGSAYVVVQEGTQQGSSWLVTTPLSVVGQDNITEERVVTAVLDAENVGSGTGTIFVQRTNNVLQFRSMESKNAYLTVQDSGDQIDFTAVAATAATASTLVARDGNGDTAVRRLTVTDNILGGNTALHINSTSGTLYVGDTSPAGVIMGALVSTQIQAPQIFVGAQASGPTTLMQIGRTAQTVMTIDGASLTVTPSTTVSDACNFSTRTPLIQTGRAAFCKISAYDQASYSNVGPTYTSVFTAPVVGSVNFAASTTGPGTIWQIRAMGVLSCTNPANLEFRIYDNSDFYSHTWVYIGGGVLSGVYWDLEIDVNATSTNTLNVFFKLNVAGQPVDYNADSISWNPAITNTMDLRVAWGAGGSTFIVHKAYMNVLNAVA